jgi:hypoxanthine phosphoribosyltransferase
MVVSSYGNSAETSGVVRIIKDLEDNIEEKNIIMTEKPVSLAIDDFTNGAYKVLPMDE